MELSDQSFEQFINAIRQGNLEDVVNRYKEEFVNRKWIDDNKYYGFAPLHLAALCGSSKRIFDQNERVRHHEPVYLDIVKYLIAKGAEINAMDGNDNNEWDHDRRTPLHFAAEIGRLDIVICLVLHGADVNKSDKDGWTPLIAAAAGGNLDIVKYLGQQGACISTSADDKRTPLHVAAQNGHLDVVKFFISNDVDVNKSNKIGGTPLCAAAGRGHLDIVKCLIDNGADVNKSDENGWTPLCEAASFGHLDVVEYLVSNGGTVSTLTSLGDTPLHTSAVNGHVDVVKYLISKGVDFSVSSRFLGTPLHLAAAQGHLEIVKYLIDCGADVNAVVGDDNVNEDSHYYSFHDVKKLTPLHSAAANGYLDVVECLMVHGANINHMDNDGRMLLHFAAIYDRMNIVEQLSSHFVNDVIAATDKYGRTAMHFAAACGHMDAFEYLLAKGGHAFLPDKNGRTPLHYAAGWGNLSIVEYLTSHGADVNAVDVGGCTPIHYAAACPKKMDDGTVINSAPVVKHLIDCDANFEMKTKACRKLYDLPSIYTLCHKDLCTSDEFSKSFIRIRKFNHQYVTHPFYYHGMRPAHLACAMENADVLQCLLQSGCMMNVKDDRNQTPQIYASLTPGGHECYELWRKHQELRRKDEFQLFHLESFTIACRKFKIFDFESVVGLFQESVLPLNRAVFFCHFTIPPNCFSSSWTVLPLMSERLQYNEYFVVKMGTEFEAIRKMVNELRDWDVEFCRGQYHVNDLENGAILLQIRSADISTSWKNHFRASFQQTAEGRPFSETTYALLQDKDNGNFIKNIFVDFLKCLHSAEIEMAFSRYPTESNVAASELLKTLIVVRKPLMTFFDENNHKLPNDTPLPRVVVTDCISIFVALKKAPDIHFWPELAAEGVPQSIRAFAGEDSVLVKGMIDGCPTFAILRKHLHKVADIKDKIKVVLSKGSRLEIISDKGINSDDTKAADVGDVVHYLIVERFLPEEIQTMDKIGSGGYGTVCPCTMSGSNERFALKKIKIENENDMNNNKGIINEILVAARIDSHPRIMKYIGFYETDKRFYIRMDLMKQSLSDYVKQNKPLDEETIKHFTKQILQGLEHLHDNKIIHRDIKGPNVLLDESNNAKLTDFGISKCLDNTQAGAETQVGTCSYMAPEIITKVDSGPYGFKCDIWSVGATMVEMITGERPFHEILAQFTIIYKLGSEKKIPFQCPDYFTSEIRRFVDWCLTADPTERPDCKEVLCDKFLV